MDTQIEDGLTGLRAIATQCGSHYIRKYLGFSIKDLAEVAGMNKKYFADIVKGRKRLTEKNEPKFIVAFERFDVVNKISKFKETEDQMNWRRQSKKWRDG